MILEDKCSFYTGVEIQKKNMEKINRRTVERTMTTGECMTTGEWGPESKKAKGREGTESLWFKPFFAIGCFLLCACGDLTETTYIKHD